MEMPDSERSYQFTADTDLRNEFHTHRTSFLLVRRQRDTGEILTCTSCSNVATASMWLKYDHNIVMFTDTVTGNYRTEDTKDTVKDVYEISMDRGIRQVGVRA